MQKIGDVKEILDLLHSPPKEDLELVKKAYEFAKEAHSGQKRFSGEPYFIHPFTVAKYLAKLGMSANMICAALLHDTIEDCGVTEETIKNEFNEDILTLVEGVTKLGTVRYQGLKRHSESLRKLFAATSKDVRVMIIKLMDRLHNARTLEYVRPDKQKRIALETLEIYAQVADRLGMGIIKRELEDAVFPYAYPEEYKKVKKIFKDAGGTDPKPLEKIHKSIKKKLAEYGIKDFKTEVRIKGLYSFYKKLQRKDWDVSKIHDIWAIRIILPTVADCYTVLGIIHAEWKPLPGRIKDYIAFPKPNGYRSIHTTIHTGRGGVIEVQIRTEDMHQEAQFGIASHLSYKAYDGSQKRKESPALKWVKQFIPMRTFYKSTEDAPTTYTNNAVPEWIRHIANTESPEKPEEFLNEIKTDFFSHRIFVFTPKGDVIDLPIDSTPIDFAYAIHSDIGHHITGAKINSKMSSIDTTLKNGDIVEIITNKKAHPTRKWLDYAKTNVAKRFIRVYLSKKSNQNP